MKKNVFLGILLVFGILIFGCVSNKEAINLTDSAVTAYGVPEGILINFESIPKDTNRLFIMLKDATENDELLTYVDIRDEELEAVKNTGNLTCPYTIKGHVYRISIIPYTGKDDSGEDFINVAAIASGGIYPEGKPLQRLKGESYVPAGDLPVHIETIRSMSDENTPWVIGIAKKDDYIASIF